MSLTRTVAAFNPSRSIADKVARWPGPVILLLSTGSFGSMAVSAMRLAPPTMSATLAKAPAGSDLPGHSTSLSCPAVSSLPKRSGFDATTIVAVLVGFLLDSRLRMRCSAWLLSHDCATKTASRPNSTANAIMTMVLLRT